MAVIDNLRALFGWTGATPPKDKPRAGEAPGFDQYGINPYQLYTNTVRPPYERRRKYDIYDEMDELPEIASILDAYAEDATQFDRDWETVFV